MTNISSLEKKSLVSEIAKWTYVSKTDGKIKPIVGSALTSEPKTESMMDDNDTIAKADVMFPHMFTPKLDFEKEFERDAYIMQLVNRLMAYGCSLISVSEYKAPGSFSYGTWGEKECDEIFLHRSFVFVYTPQKFVCLSRISGTQNQTFSDIALVTDLRCSKVLDFRRPMFF